MRRTSRRNAHNVQLRQARVAQELFEHQGMRIHQKLVECGSVRSTSKAAAFTQRQLTSDAVVGDGCVFGDRFRFQRVVPEQTTNAR